MLQPMHIIACDPMIGMPRLPLDAIHPDANDLIAEMDRLGISRAIVRHRTAIECGPMTGNAVLQRDLRDQDRLTPAWFLTPDGFAPEYDPVLAVRSMLGAGVRIAWTDAGAEGFSLRPWCCERLYESLSALRVPLMLDALTTQPDDLDEVLTAFPALRIVLFHVRMIGRNRLLNPLMERHPSLHLCLDHFYTVFMGAEDLCRRFGAARLTFGMGYPEAEGGAALASLTYADISDADRSTIAHGTIERLLSETAKETA
jgi:predicted TIM-barrel fold metal-dependent hydrolase